MCRSFGRELRRGLRRDSGAAQRSGEMVKMRILRATLLPVYLWASHPPIQVSAETVTHALPRKHAVPGTTLVHFGKVDNGVYKGSMPRTDADYRFLKSLHVRFIVDLQFLPFLDLSEQKKAKQYGIAFIPARMNASPVSPSQKHVETILAILADKRYHPVYFHCALGRDRTSLVAALHKMYFLGMSQQDAWRYMNESGYKDGWVRSGLKRYLERHPTPSPALRRRIQEHRRTANASPRDERSGLEPKQAGSLLPQ